MDIKPTKISGVKTSVTFTQKNYTNLRNYIDLVNERKKSRELNLTIAAIINSLLEDFFQQDIKDNEIKPIRITNKVSRNFKFTEDNFDNLKEYTQKFNLTYGEVINPLVEDFFKDLVLDNTFIKLDKQYSFNRNDLHENKKAIATTKPLLEIDDAIIITEVPNNCDKFNQELRTYCYDDKQSIHTGYYIFNDIHYYFIYDSSEEIIEVKIVEPANMKYYVEDDELKEKLLNDNSFVMNSLKKKLSIGDLHKTSSRPIMYKYTNYFELKRIDYGKPIRMDLVFNYFFEL